MARITRAGGVSDVRAAPETNVGPSVDAMLRRPEQAEGVDDDVERVDPDEVVERPSVDTELVGVEAVGEEPVEAELGGNEGTPVEGEPGQVPDAGSEGEGSGAGEEAAAPSTADVRAWARENEFELADSGPIPKHVQQAYDDAHPAAGTEG